jgi:hypothetical protein
MMIRSVRNRHPRGEVNAAALKLIMLLGWGLGAFRRVGSILGGGGTVAGVDVGVDAGVVVSAGSGVVWGCWWRRCRGMRWMTRWRCVGWGRGGRVGSCRWQSPETVET